MPSTILEILPKLKTGMKTRQMISNRHIPVRHGAKHVWSHCFLEERTFGKEMQPVDQDGTFSKITCSTYLRLTAQRATIFNDGRQSDSELMEVGFELLLCKLT
jgi:hypothetical protein